MTPTGRQSVSVIVCTHNGSLYIEDQLSSILAQSRLPNEIVISDDASGDDTVSRVSSLLGTWTAEYPEAAIRFVLLENEVALGVTANFESAIVHSMGEIIVLSDQDDVWHADRLLVAAQQLESSSGVDLLFSDAELVGPDGSPLGRSLLDSLEVTRRDKELIHAGDVVPLLMRRNLVTGATVMFRRRVLDFALPFPSEWVHDEWLAMMAGVFGTVDLMEQSLVDYRQHSANQIGIDAPTLRRKIDRVLQPRGDRNASLARKFEVLAERLRAMHEGVAPRILAMAQEKAEAEAFRAALPSRALARVPKIMTAARRGWYRKYASRGLMDIVRDLLQPHR
jgi:glycosyltransferase involved in cell wall biosynthesis